MKLLLLGATLLIGLNAPALSAEKNLKFKLVTIYIGQKEGESHMMGVTVSPDGSIGTKDFYDKARQGGSTGHSVYYFLTGSITANYAGTATGTATGGHYKGTYEILSGTGDYQGATGTGAFEGAYGDASPLKNAGVYDVGLNVNTP